MSNISIYQVDVFAERLFAGNPAAVCPLEAWLPDVTLQAIAAENNLAETAFFVRSARADADYDLRWFTPTVEVPLCGHATLASGHVLLRELNFSGERVRFHTHSGVLVVERRGDALWLDLPAAEPAPLPVVPADLLAGLGAQPLEWWIAASKFMAVFAHEEQVIGMTPDFSRLALLKDHGVIVTAPASRINTDFVSRFFGPALGINEDPATGSAHGMLVPYWAKRLGRSRLQAAQLSQRGARINCELIGSRVWLSGPVVPYLRGEISIT